MSIKEVIIPDLGGAQGVDVIEILVAPGDEVNIDDSLISLESDKATMEVPAPFAGIIKEIKAVIGDKLSEGDVVLTMSIADDKAASVEDIAAPKEEIQATVQSPISSELPATTSTDVELVTKIAQDSATSSNIHATPAVRRIASEFGIDLSRITGTAEKGRVSKEDVQLFVKQQMASPGANAAGLNIPSMPVVDFSKFGETELHALTKINRLTGDVMRRNWLSIPHVTQFDEVDITDMEAFRQQNKARAEKLGFKLTPLIFIMKAVAAGLKQFPKFNSSLAANGQELIMKKYFHVGIAVDTPNGLVVPVVRDVDQKSVFEIAKELGEISIKAREGKLLPRDMQGGSMTISSLGGIGGTAFTPIVNAPEVAILGVSKSQTKPVYQNGEFVPRLMLPLSLSYDHRVIDGADGARFITLINQMLSDLRQLIL